jgi:hypothetical protein
MLPNTKIRKSKRLEHETLVMLVDEAAGTVSFGLMVNCSPDGMCFYSDAAFNPGTKIKIRLDAPLFGDAPDTYHGLVSWCKGLDENNSEYYLNSIGVKYC